MKKILLATSTLAFAGSAFAADVSGYAISAYKKHSDIKSLYNETEVYVSGSKTASNGLTFGATYTLGFFGAGKAQTDDYDAVKRVTLTGADASIGGVGQIMDRNRDNKNKIVAAQEVIAKAAGNKSVITTQNGIITAAENQLKADKIRLADTKKQANASLSRSQYAGVNAFVSGSFGKVEMGRHNIAARSIGAASIAVGNGYDSTVTALDTREKTNSGVTYTSPLFNGVQFAYTTGISDKSARSLAIKYAGSASGVDFALAYGTLKEDGSNTKAYGVKVAKGPFAISYAKDGSQTKQMGVSYTAGQISIGYSQAKLEDGTKNHVLSSSYQVASGLTAFAEHHRKDGEKTILIGTNISF